MSSLRYSTCFRPPRRVPHKRKRNRSLKQKKRHLESRIWVRSFVVIIKVYHLIHNYVFVLCSGSYKKDQQLIELQDTQNSRQQVQLQEEADLRALQEQEQSIKQLEVRTHL